MSTLSVMRTRIADDVKRSDLNSQIDRFINKSIEHYESEDFWFKEVTATFSTSANQTVYTSADSGFPTDVQDIDYVELSYSSSTQYELVPNTFNSIQRMDPGNSSVTGNPTDYAWYNNSMFLYPTPNAVYEVKMYYRQTYSELTSDNATCNFITEGADLIEARAAYYVCSRTIKDYEAAAVYKQQEMEALKSLREKTDKKNSTGRVKRKAF